ncbi:hypothetical protein HDU92_004253 [Lobulomyces angularis]|nr:hypothetical protein HDU92_004253 [Lobulomyces angularis]
MLFSFGSNQNGQLGNGNLEDSSLPQRVFFKEKVKSISLGSNHTILLSSTGSVWSCGLNDFGQIGFNEDVSQSLVLKEAELVKGHSFLKASCGWNHTLLMDSEGSLFSLGNNEFGQLGINKSELKNFSYGAFKLFRVDITKKVTFISSGYRSNVALTEDGEVFVWGQNKHGELGKLIDNELEGIKDVNKKLWPGKKGMKNTASVIYKPKIIAFPEPIIQVEIGQYHTLALSQSGRVYMQGKNNKGQLSINPLEVKSCELPFELKLKGISVSSITAGWSTSGALSTEGKVYFWGRNDLGQLGTIRNTVDCWQPHEIPFKNNIIMVSTCSEYSLALDNKLNIFAWGWNEHGNLGTGNLNNALQPVRICLNSSEENSKKVIDRVVLCSGYGHTFLSVDYINSE